MVRLLTSILFSLLVIPLFSSSQSYAQNLAQCPKEGLYCPEGNRRAGMECRLDDTYILSCPGFSSPGGGPAMKVEVPLIESKGSSGDRNVQCDCNQFPANLKAVGLFLQSGNSVTQLRLFWLNDDSKLEDVTQACQWTRKKLVELGICSKDSQSQPQIDMSGTGGSCAVAKSVATTQCHHQGFSTYWEDHCTPERYGDMDDRDAESVGKCI
jgi:hypothetical protein